MKLCPTVLPLFESQESPDIKKFYRPSLHRLDFMPNKGQRFLLIFVEMRPEAGGHPEGYLAPISSLLELGKELRWGVFKRYQKSIKQLVSEGSPSPEKIKGCLEGLDSSIRKIVFEEIRLSLDIPEEVAQAFTEQDDKDKITELMNKWRDFKGELTDRIDSGDIENILETLDSMLNISKDSMVLTAKEYHKLLDQMD